ncbi:hypothetical protein ACFQX4_21035 [Roseomonas sp. GCM10028921]
MDAAFEQLMDREPGTLEPVGSEAAVMRAVRDEVVRRATEARRRRGPDPIQRGRPPMPEMPLPDAVAAQLAAYVSGLEETDEPLPVPADLAAALIAALPSSAPHTAFPSRTAAAKERSLAALGRATFMRGELASNNLATVEPLVRAALERAGTPAPQVIPPVLLEAGMHGAMAGFREVAAQEVAFKPNPGGTAQSVEAQGPSPAPPPSALPHPGAAARPPAPPARPARPAPLSPDTPLSVAFGAFRKAKRVDRAWKQDAERDAETTIRLFTEFFGDLPLRGITRELVREFRGNLLVLLCHFLFRLGAEFCR